MIELTAVTAGYGGEDKLHDIHLRLQDGEIHTIVGPNGCGKSTLLKVLCGLLPPSAGRVLVEGRPVGSYTPRELARRVAYLPQGRDIPSITVGRLVLHGRFPYLSYPRHYREEDRAAAREAMTRTGVLGYAETPMASLSGGERQKVYIAMALAQGTPVILLDEPTTYLDIGHQLELMRLVQGLTAEGKTVVLVLHDLDLALRFSDRVTVMQQGRIVAGGRPAEVAAGGQLEAVFGVHIGHTDDDGIRHYYFE